tara:strand:+ start:76 stop:1491 length:1416 start_codon:yes stop_codon:yes gene_type:complete
MQKVWIIGEDGTPKEVLKSLAESEGMEFFETQSDALSSLATVLPEDEQSGLESLINAALQSTGGTGNKVGDIKTENGVTYIFTAEGVWEEKEPTGGAEGGGEEKEYWFRHNDGYYGKAKIDEKPENVSWVWELPEFKGSQEEYSTEAFSDTSSLIGSASLEGPVVDEGLDDDIVSSLLFEDTTAEDVISEPEEQYQQEAPTITAREEIKLRFPFLDERLIGVYEESYVDTGDSELALLSMRSDPMMEVVYPGIRKEDGTLRMTEQEYYVVNEAMSLELRGYGLNPQEFKEDIAEAISGDVSVSEFKERLNVGYEQIVNQIPEVKDIYLREFNLDLNEESIFAMFISPKVTTKVLEGQIRASQILAQSETALGAGALTVQVAKGLARAGLTQEGARAGFQQAAYQLPGLSAEAQAQGRGDITAEEYIRASQLGEVKYQEEISRVTQQLASGSSVRAGAATQKGGQVSGLIEG